MSYKWGIPVGELKRRMTAREFMEMKVYLEMEPLGGLWEPFAMLAHIFCLSKRVTIPPDHFIPIKRRETPLEQTTDEMVMIFESYVEQHNNSIDARRSRK